MTKAPLTARELVLRALGGGTARDLSVKLDTSERTVRHWLAGDSKPGYEHTMTMLGMIREREASE